MLIIIIIVCLLSASIANAEIYKYIDANGQAYFTDQKKDSISYRLVSRITFTDFGVHSGNSQGFDVEKFRANVRRFTPTINRMANAHSISPALLHAVVYVESGYEPRAVSSSGCIGLMQLKPSTATEYGVRDIWDPEQNIRGGAKYLNYLLDLFDGNLRLAVASYNAGQNAVLRHNSTIPPYPETQRYVKKVIKRYRYLLSKD
ncbi:MAG: lytic transglycosylase domain-containing protein [Mariprofundales bacterium]